MRVLLCVPFLLFAARGSIVFSIVAVFFSVNTIIHEPLHLA